MRSIYLYAKRKQHAMCPAFFHNLPHFTLLKNSKQKPYILMPMERLSISAPTLISDVLEIYFSVPQ